MSDFISYSMYQPTPEDETPLRDERIRVLDGATRITMSNGETTTDSLNVAYFDSRTDINTFDKSDWRSTARKKGGTPTATIDKDTIVTINGVSATAESLRQAGILDVNEKGEYVEAGYKAPEDSPEDLQRVSAERQAEMSTATVDAVNRAVEALDDRSLESMTQLGIASITGAMTEERLISAMSQKSGLDPQASAESISTVRAAYQAQADDYLVGKVGISRAELESFYSFCREPKNEGLLRNAITQQIYSHRMDGYQPLVKAYFTGTSMDRNALIKEGIETRKGPNGKDLVCYQGMWIDTKTAAKLGLM